MDEEGGAIESHERRGIHRPGYQTVTETAYKGIHSVYNGLKPAFKECFGKNPLEVTQRLVQEGKIVTRPVRGGVMLYLPEDAPQPKKRVLGEILKPEE